MNAVEIIFTGIVYLLGPTAAAPTLEVIVPNASETIAPFGEVLHGHDAYLKVKSSDVANLPKVAAVRPPQLFFRGPDSSVEYVVFSLTGDSISLGTTTNEKFVPPVEACLTQCGKKFNQTDLESYERVPHQTKICPDCEPLDPIYKTTTNAGLVSARFTAVSGRVAAGRVSKDEWEFRPRRSAMSNPHSGRIADEAVLHVTPPSGNVTLTLTPFTGPAVTLELKPGASVEIGNLMTGDIIGLDMGHEPPPVDQHFARFYTLLERPFTPDHHALSDPPVPHTKGLAKPGGIRINCVPIVYP